jgi:hypothetical protein
MPANPKPSRADCARCSTANNPRVSRLTGELLGLDLGKPAGRFEQAVMIGAAAGAALQVDSRAGVHACGVFPCELQLDVGVEDFLTGRATRIPLLGA